MCGLVLIHVCSCVCYEIPPLSFHDFTVTRGLKLLVYEALSYSCIRPYATSVYGLKLLVYEA